MLRFWSILLACACAVWSLLPAAADPYTARANPPDAPVGGKSDTAHPATASTRFAELAATSSGRALTARFDGAKSVDDAIQQTGDALVAMFDAKPQFDGVAVDSKTRNRGLASFSAAIKGSAVKGIVLFNLDAQGAAANVIYSRPDAPQAEVQALMASLPATQPMQTYTFPMKDGTIDLPRGWATDARSATDAIRVTGPAGQRILYNITVRISTPNGMEMRQWRSNNDQLRRLGSRQLQPPPQGVFSDLANPESTVQKILPALQEKQRQAGQTWTEVGEVLDAAKAAPNPHIAGAEAGLFHFRSIRHEGPTATKIREMDRIETYPINDGKDFWAISINGFTAPDDAFDRDLPLMKDIIETLKLAPDALQRRQNRDNQQLGAILQWGEEQHQILLARGRQYQEEQNDRFNRMQANDQARRQARHDANSDFQEMISGYRTVYDSGTGVNHSVDYYRVDEITNAWNAAANDPNRYIQIPLR